MRKDWKNYKIKIIPTVITKALLQNNINKFFNEIINNLDVNQHALFIFRVMFEDNQIATITPLQKINKDCQIELIDYIFNKLSLSNEAYSTKPVKSLIFSYGLRKGKIKPSLIVENKESPYHTFYSNKLPISFNFSEYGKIINQKGKQYIISVNKKTFIILESIDSKTNKVQYFKNNQILFNWTDTLLEKDYFTREIGKSIYHFRNKELILIKQIRKTKPINKTKVAKSLDVKFITMDLETVLIDNTHIPYLLCWYDGSISKSYIINSLDPSTIELDILRMISRAIDDILIRKYRDYKIYLHNFSKFDGYFLLKYLARIGKCKPIIHKGKIISVKFTYNNYTVTFKDSYLLLPSSLRKLGKSFNVETQKGIFPYLLSDINYSGEVPNIQYFSNVSLDEYNKYKDSFNNKIWCFKTEAIKYCKLDCISLYQILFKFNTLLYKIFILNINNYPTLPSLAFAIFKTHFIKNKEHETKNIHMLSGQVSNDIRQGYTGGSCDMFISTPSIKDTKIYAYDVNSLYPYVMSKFKMPTGSPTYFSGDITKYNKDAFGFFYCNITTPEKLDHPILQTHIKTNDGIRTVSPLGTWSDILFSEEMYNAEKYGYKFEILWGYTFESDYVFKGFVNILYKIRLEYPKSDPMNYIAKIIMNSLYGRFGMDDNFSFSKIMNKRDYNKFESSNQDGIIDVIDLGGNLLVQHKNPKVELNTLLDNASEIHNVNIAVASAITAYSRIHMSQFKNNKDYNLYYSDTDSIYIDKPLENSFISDKILGKLKLEYICKDAVFIAPKVYGLLTDKDSIIKIKGLSLEAINKISIKNLKDLLIKDSNLESKQNKWFKSLSNGNINVKEQIYTLKVTGNKR